MGAKVVTKVFMNGGSQAVRIPAEMRFDSDEVVITFDKKTRAVTIRPVSADERKAAFIDSLRNASADERQELNSAFELNKEYSVPEINKRVADFFLGEDR